jgi:hypothetical protein
MGHEAVPLAVRHLGVTLPALPVGFLCCKQRWDAGAFVENRQQASTGRVRVSSVKPLSG